MEAFLTCEAKCGYGGLNIADRQNAHSMTVALRRIVQLFKEVEREKELHRKVLAFSILHGDEVVRIFGHYPVIDGDKTTFYHHPFDFGDLDGKEKWTAYKFTKNLYDVWMPDHYKLICSAIDDIPPDIYFEVSLGGSFTPIAGADESELPDSQEVATSAPSSQNTVGFKKARLPLKITLQKENEQLQKKLDQEREQSNKRLTELMKQMAKEKESNQRLTEQNEKLLDMLKQRLNL